MSQNLMVDVSRFSPLPFEFQYILLIYYYFILSQQIYSIYNKVPQNGYNSLTVGSVSSPNTTTSLVINYPLNN